MKLAKLTTALVAAIVLCWTNPAAGLVVFDYAEDWDAPDFLEFEVSTDQWVYEPGEDIQVDVTVLNTGETDYTLEFPNSHQAGYVMDRTYDWAYGRGFLDVLTEQEVPAQGSHTWTFDHDWEAYRPEGESEVIGYVPGYGWSDPAMFKVVQEDEVPRRPKLGDVTLDGTIGDDDIDKLEDALEDPSQYEEDHGIKLLWVADMNQDGELTEDDIGLLRRRVKGLPGDEPVVTGEDMDSGEARGYPLVPEPATLGLLGIGGLGILLRRRR